MKLSGKYGVVENIKVDIIFKKGKFDLVKNDSKIGNITFPVRPVDYEVVGTGDEFGLPITHKYAVKYTDQFNNEQYVFVDICIFRKWWIEIRKNKKFNIIRLVFWALAIVGATVLTVLTENKINSLINPSNKTHAEKNAK